MRQVIAAVLTVGWVTIGAAAPVPKSLRKAHTAELKQLEGTWVLVSREEGGWVTTAADDRTTFTVTGDRWAWKVGGRVEATGTFKLTHIGTSPKQWEYQVAGGGTGYSIYDVEGDTFRYCSTGSADTRPTEFATGVKGGGGYCCVWKRKE